MTAEVAAAAGTIGTSRMSTAARLPGSVGKSALAEKPAAWSREASNIRAVAGAGTLW